MKKVKSILTVSTTFALALGSVVLGSCKNNTCTKDIADNVSEVDTAFEGISLSSFSKAKRDVGLTPIVSKTFAKIEDKDSSSYLSFAVAVDVTRAKTLKLTRSVEGKETKTKEVSTVYKGLKTSDGGLYYNSATGELTSDISLWDENYYIGFYSIELTSGEAKDLKISVVSEVATVEDATIVSKPTITSYNSMNTEAQYRVSYYDLEDNLLEDNIVGKGEKANNLSTGDPCVKWFNGDNLFDFNNEINSDLELHQKVSHDYEKHDEKPATCASTGIGEYYTCEHCDLLFKFEKGEYVEIDEIPVLPIDPNNHEEDVGLELTTTGVKTTYVIGDTFDATNLVVTKKCSECEGEVIASGKYSIEYPTKDETSFVAADVGTEKEVTIKYGEYSAVIKVTVNKKANDITGFANLDKHCGFKPFASLEGVSATHGTIVYKFAETQDGTYKTAEELGDDYEFVAESGQESSVFYYKAIVAEDDEFYGVEKSGTITVSHNFGWDTSDDEVDVFSCSCDEGHYEFDKVVEGDAQDIVLTSDSKSIALTGTSYNSVTDTVKSIMLGEVSLGTSLEALDFTNVPTSVYGEQTILVTVTSGEVGSRTAADHVIEVPVIVITDVIKNNEASIKKVFAYKDDTRTYPITGYYVLGEDIDHSSYVFGYYSGWDSEDLNKFSGIVDGRNHTVKSKSSFSGVFGRLNGATIKNLTVTDAWYHNYNDQSLLASGMTKTTLDNVTMKVLANNDPILEPGENKLGWVCRNQFQDNTIKNCTFDATGKIVTRLFSSNNSTNSNTIVNSTFKCDQFYSLYKDYSLGEIYQMNGLTVQGNVYSTLTKQTITIYEDKSIPSSISLNGDRFENATVNSITLGKYNLGNDITALALSDEAIADESIRGDQNIIINVTEGEATFNYNVPVNIAFVSAYTEDTLTTKQYLLTENETTSLSLAGTAYEGGTVESIKLGGEDLGTNLSSITLPSSIKTDKTKHVDTTVDVLVKVDGDKYLVHIPVLVVTKAIGDWSTFAGIFQGANKYSKDIYTTGSYILTSDISISSNLQVTGTDDSGAAWVGYGNAIITGSGFKGIFDGCGHKMTQTGGSIYLGGLFGVVTGGAIVRNVEICNFAAKADSSYSGILGVQFNNSTLENVTFNIASVTGTADKTGLICNQYFRNNTVKNVTINAQGSTIYNVLGGYWGANATAGGSTFENFVINAKEIVNAFSTNSWGGVVAYNGTNLPSGITFNADPIEVTLTNKQYLLTETETASLSLVGTDYEEDVESITSVKLDGYDLGTDLSSLELPSAIKLDKSKHVDSTVTIALNHDGAPVNVKVPVLVVTKAIGDWSTFASIFQGANKYSKDIYTTGSYILTSDISISSNLQVTGTDDSGAAWVGYGNAIITGSGFKGIFDGCGHKMTQTGGSIYLGGLFGVVTGGSIVRNVEICNFAAKADSSYSGILGVQFNNSTLENVTFNIASVTGTADKTGLICNQYFRNNTVKNVKINAQGSTIYNVLGGYWGANATAGGSTFENFVINAGAVVNAFSTNSWGGVVAYDGTNLPEGITVNITA